MRNMKKRKIKLEPDRWWIEPQEDGSALYGIYIDAPLGENYVYEPICTGLHKDEAEFILKACLNMTKKNTKIQGIKHAKKVCSKIKLPFVKVSCAYEYLAGYKTALKDVDEVLKLEIKNIKKTQTFIRYDIQSNRDKS